MAGTALGTGDSNVQDKQNVCPQSTFILECEAGKEHVDKKYILSFQTPIEGGGVSVLLL